MQYTRFSFKRNLRTRPAFGRPRIKSLDFYQLWYYEMSIFASFLQYLLLSTLRIQENMGKKVESLGIKAMISKRVYSSIGYLRVPTYFFLFVCILGKILLSFLCRIFNYSLHSPKEQRDSME